MADTPLAGIIVVDKPQGPTSNEVLGRLKRLLGLGGRRGPKAGFLGTLDPLASGVLPVFVGKATKLIALFEGLEKTYRVTVRLGERTDTGDAEGTVLETRDTAHLDEAAVRCAVLGFQGSMEQQVPQYAAVKYGGVPGYKLARAGHEVQPPTRRVTLREVAVEAVALPDVTFRVTASAGTYMRSLAADLGAALGVGGHVVALRRLACGRLFTLQNSISLSRIEEAWRNGEDRFVQSPAVFLPDHHPITVEGASERRLREGQAVALAEEGPPLQPQAPLLAVRSDGTAVAVGRAEPAGAGRLAFQPSRVLV